jgi:hypothetical protein
MLCAPRHLLKHVLPQTVAVLNAVLYFGAVGAIILYMPLTNAGVTVWLVNDSTSVRVQQCAYIADSAIPLCVLAAIVTRDLRYAVTPLTVFAGSLCSTGIFESKMSREYYW